MNGYGTAASFRGAQDDFVGPGRLGSGIPVGLEDDLLRKQITLGQDIHGAVDQFHVLQGQITTTVVQEEVAVAGDIQDHRIDLGIQRLSLGTHIAEGADDHPV